MNYKLLSIHWYDDASEELLTFNGLRHFSYSESSLFSKLYASIEIDNILTAVTVKYLDRFCYLPVKYSYI